MRVGQIRGTEGIDKSAVLPMDGLTPHGRTAEAFRLGALMKKPDANETGGSLDGSRREPG